MTSKVKAQYIITQGILYLIAPVASFIVSLRFYKNTISQVFFVLFAFYFGYQTDVLMDLENHYTNGFLRQMQIGLLQAVHDPECLYLGEEPYHFIFKWFVGLFSTSSRFFAGCAAAVYASVFLFFINQYKQFFNNKLRITQLLVFLGIIFTVEYYWYLGLRYWTGAFFFLAFYSKYVLTQKRKYIFISCLCILFHFAHLAIVAALVINWLFGNKKFILYTLIVISFAFRFSYNRLDNILEKLPFAENYVKANYLDPTKQEASEEKAAYFREEGNIIYQNRSNIILFALLILFFFIWKSHKNIFKTTYHSFFTFLLSFIPVVNMAYSSLILYDRTFKLLLVMAFCYAFLILQNPCTYWINKKVGINILLSMTVLFSLLTAIVQQRDTLLDMELWFSNLFITSN